MPPPFLPGPSRLVEPCFPLSKPQGTKGGRQLRAGLRGARPPSPCKHQTKECWMIMVMWLFLFPTSVAAGLNSLPGRLNPTPSPSALERKLVSSPFSPSACLLI